MQAFVNSIGIARQGANVYIVARSKEKGEEAVKEIKAASGNNNVKYFVANLSSQKCFSPAGCRY